MLFVGFQTLVDDKKFFNAAGNRIFVFFEQPL